MTINEVFEKAIKETQSLGTYKGQFYSPEGVVAIIRDLQKQVVGNGVIGVVNEAATVTSTDMYELVEALEERISDNINDINEGDIVDTSTLEASISGDRITIDNLDVDKGLIVNESQYGLDETIREWCYKHKILIED